MAAPNITPNLHQHIVPIDSITPWPGNPRQGDHAGIAESLADQETGGQYLPLVVQKSTGQICVGNNTWIAAKEHLGWDSIAVNHVDLTDAQAKKLLARDNRLSDKGDYNKYLLADFLADIHQELGTLEGTGYEPTDLDDLLKTTGALATQGTDFLAGFIPDDAPTSTPSPSPTANPFSDAPTPAPPQTNTQPTPPAPDTEPTQTTPQETSEHGPGVHTGPTTYTGPGSPTTPAANPDLPQRPDLVTVQWVVTVEQRETIRSAIKHAQTTATHETAADALTAVCSDYLTVHSAENE